MNKPYIDKYSGLVLEDRGGGSIQVVPISGSTVTLPNVQGGKAYVCADAVEALNITSVTSSEAESQIRFVAASGGCICNWGSGIKWHGGELPTIEGGKEYIVSIQAMYGVGGEFAEVQ